MKPQKSGTDLILERIFYCKNCNDTQGHDITYSNEFSVKLSVPVNPPYQRMLTFVTFKADNSTTTFFIIKICKKCGIRTLIVCQEVQTI